MTIGILVPVVLFFGFIVVAAGMMSQMAMSNIDHIRSPD